MHRLFLAVLFTFLGPATSHGACLDLKNELDRTMERVHRIAGANGAIRDSQLDFLRQCESAGAEISAEMAASREGLSCESLKTADAVYSKMKLLGTQCQQSFSRFKEKNAELVTLIAAEREGANGALELILESELFRRACPREVKVARGLKEDLEVSSFLIKNIDAVSTSLTEKYSKFTAMSSTLKLKSQRGGGNCERVMNELAAATKPQSQRVEVAAPAASGQSRNPNSTITGKIENDQLDSVPASKPHASKPGPAPSAQEDDSYRSSGSIARPPRLEKGNLVKFPSIGNALWEDGQHGLELQAETVATSGAFKDTDRAPASVVNAEDQANASSAAPSVDSLPKVATLYPSETGEGAEAARWQESALAPNPEKHGADADSSLFTRVHSAYERSWGVRVVIPLPGARMLVKN